MRCRPRSRWGHEECGRRHGRPDHGHRPWIPMWVCQRPPRICRYRRRIREHSFAHPLAPPAGAQQGHQAPAGAACAPEPPPKCAPHPDAAPSDMAPRPALRIRCTHTDCAKPFDRLRRRPIAQHPRELRNRPGRSRPRNHCASCGRGVVGPTTDPTTDSGRGCDVGLAALMASSIGTAPVDARTPARRALGRAPPEGAQGDLQTRRGGLHSGKPGLRRRTWVPTARCAQALLANTGTRGPSGPRVLAFPLSRIRPPSS